MRDLIYQIEFLPSFRKIICFYFEPEVKEEHLSMYYKIFLHVRVGSLSAIQSRVKQFFQLQEISAFPLCEEGPPAELGAGKAVH